MRVSVEKQQLCPCYKECQEFQKLAELKGLGVYCHRPRVKDIRQAEVPESAANISRDVFILYNKKSVKVTTSQLTLELETKNISCPRCRKTFERAQQLIQEVKSIDGKVVLGICDHCRKKATIKTTTKTMKKSLCPCEEIVKKFRNVKGEEKEDIKNYVKTWLSKMGHLLKDDLTLKKRKQIETRAHSDLQINRGFNSPASQHEPEIQQMFYSETHKSDVNLSTEMREIEFNERRMKQAAAFFQPIELVETTLAHIPHESAKINEMISSTLLKDSDTTMTEKYTKELPKTSLKDRNQEEIFEDIPSVDAKEALKRRHDLNLRQIMGLEKGSRVPYSVQKRSDIYETPKVTPWAQEDPISKYQEGSEMNFVIPTDYIPRDTRDLDYESMRKVKFRSTRPSQDSFYEPKIGDKYHHDRVKQGLRDSEDELETAKVLDNHYITDKELKLQLSVDKISHNQQKLGQDVAKSKSWHEKVVKPKESVGYDYELKSDYSLFFPKVMKKEERPVRVTSSHLSKDTEEKLRLQAERDTKKDEEKRQQKLEQDQKQKLEEKKQQYEQKRRQAVEDKKYAEDQNRQQDKVKRDTTKKYTFNKDGKSELKCKISKESFFAKKEKNLKHEGDKTAKLLQKAKKDLKTNTEKEEKVPELLQKAKKDLKTKPEKEDKIAELLQKDNKELKEKREKEDKIAKLLQKSKKDLKTKPEKEEKVAELLQKDKKDLRRKPEKEDKIAEFLQKDKKDFKTKPENTKIEAKDKSKLGDKRDDEIIDKGKGDLEKPTPKSKDDDLISKAMKDQKKKREVKDKDDKTLEKGKKDLKEKPETIEKGTKDLKSGIEQKDKINVPEKDLKAKSLQNVKEQKEQDIKTEKELQDEKLKREQEAKEHNERLKQIEQLRKEKEALKLQAAKERDGLLKEIKSPKKKRESLTGIKLSISKQKSVIKGEKDESDYKPEISVKKQEEKKEKEGNQKEIIVKESLQTLQFKKLQAAHLKEKEETERKKKQQEYEAKVAKAREESKKQKTEALKLTDINLKTEFSDENLILGLVRMKQDNKLTRADMGIELLKENKLCKHGIIASQCPLCLDSEMGIDVFSLNNKLHQHKEIRTDIIIGESIHNIKRHLKKMKEPEVDAILYRKILFFKSELSPTKIVELIPQEAESVQNKMLSKKDAKEIEMEPGKGILRYALSDRTFIDKGWTMLPTEKVVRKMNVYRMRPAHPEFDWFEHNKNKRLMNYDSGERLAEFDDNGRGRWYYRNGRLALDYYDAEETNAQQRFVIYSSGEPDERGRTHPITILATFDYLGNGIVFDHSGKIRLKYNQTEGVVLDRGIGPVSHWKWHTLNDPPVLQQVMIDTQMAHKDPNILKLGTAAEKKTRPDNEEMLAIEFDNFIKEKSKKLSQKFKPFQIKMKALKINEHFSLKVLDQATVYLIFRDGSTNLKLNIGMILDHQEIVDTDTAEVGEVSNSLERFPARTDSLAALQRSVAYAQRYERQQIERERRLRPSEPCASADQLTAAASPPLRLPFRTVPTASSSSTGCYSRKPTNNLYYNTRLL